MKTRQMVLALVTALSISTAGITAEKIHQDGYSQNMPQPSQRDLFTRSATTQGDDPCWLYWYGEWFYIC